MIKRTIDMFRKKQNMNDDEYEVFLYSDAKAPKVFPHRHTFYEIYYLISDHLDYIVGNQIYHLRKGDFILLPPGLLHYPSSYEELNGQKYERIVLWVALPFFEQFCGIDSNLNNMVEKVITNQSYHIHPSHLSSQQLYHHLLRLVDEKRSTDFVSRAMEFSILLETFALINRMLQTDSHLENHTTSSDMFDSIIYYIHTHLTEELTLSRLAEHFFVSTGYITKLFRESMGIPAYQYILSLRLEAVKKLIVQGSPITEAAEIYGFHDYSGFYRAFKNAFATSPKAYQKSLFAEKKRLPAK